MQMWGMCYFYLQQERIVAFFHFCTVGWEIRQCQGVNRVQKWFRWNSSSEQYRQVHKKKKERSLWCSLVCEVSGFRSFTRSRLCCYRFCEKFSEYLLPRNYAHRNSLTGKWVIWKYSNEHNIFICFETFPKNTTVGFVMISGI